MADRASAAHERHDAELVPGCPRCEALAPDLAAISASLASLRGGLDGGHRDFRLTATDAHRLRRGRGIRAWLRPIAGPSFGFARPLGGTLTVVALVGLLASSLPQGFAAGGALELTSAESGRDPDHLTEPPRLVASPSADAAFEGLSSPKAGASDAALMPDRQLTVAPSRVADSAPVARAGPAAQPGVVLASLTLLTIGLLLVVGRGIARRLIGAAREP